MSRRARGAPPRQRNSWREASLHTRSLTRRRRPFFHCGFFVPLPSSLGQPEWPIEWPTKTTVRVLQPLLAFKSILRFDWTIRRLRIVVLQLCPDFTGNFKICRVRPRTSRVRFKTNRVRCTFYPACLCAGFIPVSSFGKCPTVKCMLKWDKQTCHNMDN